MFTSSQTPNHHSRSDSILNCRRGLSVVFFGSATDGSQRKRQRHRKRKRRGEGGSSETQKFRIIYYKKRASPQVSDIFFCVILSRFANCRWVIINTTPIGSLSFSSAENPIGVSPQSLQKFKNREKRSRPESSYGAHWPRFIDTCPTQKDEPDCRNKKLNATTE